MKKFTSIRQNRKKLSSKVNYTFVDHSKTDEKQILKSTLKEDFIAMLEFDNYVECYCEKPFEIEYSFNGEKQKYIPDFYIKFRSDLDISKNMKSIICEVENKNILREKSEEYKLKFKAAKEFAEKKDWIFCIITEKNIKTSFLNNINFLMRYVNSKHVNSDIFDILYNTLLELEITTPNELILCVCKDNRMQAEAIFTLWYMVASGGVGCDLHKPLTMKSEIWNRR